MLSTKLTLYDSSISLVECVNNFLAWTDVPVPKALRCVTATPATMLGLAGIKGTLVEGADADLVVFDQIDGVLLVDEVWKFGHRIFQRSASGSCHGDQLKK